MVLLLPDALHQLTGLEPETLTNRFVDAQAVLPPDWHPMLAAVQSQPDSASRLACLEDFLEPRWQACRPAHLRGTQRYTDWANHLAQRAALSAPRPQPAPAGAAHQALGRAPPARAARHGQVRAGIF